MPKNPKQPTERKITGDVHKSRCRRHAMDPMINAAIWFWIPLLLVPLGIWLNISDKAKLAGIICSIVGLLLLTFKNFSGFSPYNFQMLRQDIFISSVISFFNKINLAQIKKKTNRL